MNIEPLYQIYQAHPEVTTDSRRCPAGSLFFALKGDNFDGNRFAATALEAGCAFAVIDEPEFAVPGDDRYILVDDALKALQTLAAYHRRHFSGPVIQVTGTNGKTTTKELVSTVLSERFQVLFTQGNLNNHIGVPLTLLRLRPDHDIAVIETGANHPGEIAFLTNLVQPDFGLITNVGRAHIEGFGSFDGVKRTKGELYDYLGSHEGRNIFFNAGDAVLTSMLAERGIDSATRGIAYSKQPDKPSQTLVSGKVLECNPFVKFAWKAATGQLHEIQTHLIGAYNIDNLLAAACVGTHFGVSEAEVCHALNHYVPSLGRSEFRKGQRNDLIIDAYNANPTSMHAALANFLQIPAERKMLILGDMRELGTDSEQAHAQILEEATNSLEGEVWLVGDEFAKAAHKLGLAERPSLRLFANVQEVKAAIAAEQPAGRLILIKGSNSMRLAELPDLL